MPVMIRLRRVGRKKQPSYRVVVTDATRPRDGQYIETVGFYNPRREPAELRLDLERVEAWVDQGAELSETVRSLVRKARKGGDAKVGLMTAAAPEVAPAPEPAKPQQAPKAEAAPPVAKAEAAPAEAAPEQPEAEAAAEEPATAEAPAVDGAAGADEPAADEAEEKSE